MDIEIFRHRIIAPFTVTVPLLLASSIALGQVLPLERVADTRTAIPGGEPGEIFTGFGGASTSVEEVAFRGYGEATWGIYSDLSGSLAKVVDGSLERSFPGLSTRLYGRAASRSTATAGAERRASIRMSTVPLGQWQTIRQRFRMANPESCFPGSACLLSLAGTWLFRQAVIRGPMESTAILTVY